MHLSKPDTALQGTIVLDGSKSLSNRALMVLALAGADPPAWLCNCSTSRDTATLQRLLAAGGDTWDAGDAGTTFRFLTAYLALQPGVQRLTGSPRMCERPIGPLVKALRTLGADIEYAGNNGYPPLQIGEPGRLGSAGSRVRVNAGISSQFLSALLLIGPCLPEGLEIVPDGQLVSRPYLEMTMQLMRYFGAEVAWRNKAIVVAPGRYQPRKFVVEADWSAASYWYAMAAFANSADLTLKGLFAGSWQGDSVLADMMPFFGVQTTAVSGGIQLRKSADTGTGTFEWDFLDCPDIAQTLAVVCAGLGVSGLFSGLETLAVKETDRIAALRTELAKTGVAFEQLPGRAIYRVSGKAAWQDTPRFSTYGDHRIAMAFAPLAMLGPVDIEHPDVVAKSYPMFWDHLAQAGFILNKRMEP